MYYWGTSELSKYGFAVLYITKLHAFALRLNCAADGNCKPSLRHCVSRDGRSFARPQCQRGVPTIL